MNRLAPLHAQYGQSSGISTVKVVWFSMTFKGFTPRKHGMALAFPGCKSLWCINPRWAMQYKITFNIALIIQKLYSTVYILMIWHWSHLSIYLVRVGWQCPSPWWHRRQCRFWWWCPRRNPSGVCFLYLPDWRKINLLMSLFASLFLYFLNTPVLLFFAFYLEKEYLFKIVFLKCPCSNTIINELLPFLLRWHSHWLASALYYALNNYIMAILPFLYAL